MHSFFDQSYRTPSWLQKRLSRRHFLKSAALASAATAVPMSALAAAKLAIADLSIEPWRSLDAVLNHLLPSSDSGPGAKELKVVHYVFNVINSQPSDPAEQEFISNGVGWLNGYTQKNSATDFALLNNDQKEAALRAISQSTAGENWLSTLLSYIFEAMLAPPSYGGNPDGIGWQWLNHQAGFPLPPTGKRYYELPSYALNKAQRINITDIDANDDALKQGKAK